MWAGRYPSVPELVVQSGYGTTPQTHTSAGYGVLPGSLRRKNDSSDHGTAAASEYGTLPASRSSGYDAVPPTLESQSSSSSLLQSNSFYGSTLANKRMPRQTVSSIPTSDTTI